MYKILRRSAVSKRNGKGSQNTKRVHKTENKVVFCDNPDDKEWEDIEEDANQTASKTGMANSKKFTATTGRRKNKNRCASETRYNSQEAAKESPSELVKCPFNSLYPSSLAKHRIEEGRAGELSIKLVRGAAMLLIESCVLPSREKLEFGLERIGEFISSAQSSSLLFMGFYGVTFKTAELIQILITTPQLEALGLFHTSWDEGDENLNNFPRMPRLPNLQTLALIDHHKKDEFYFEGENIAAVRRIIDPYYTQLSHLLIDGETPLLYEGERDQKTFGKLEVLEVVDLNPDHFLKSSLASAPLRKLVINKILDDEETVQNVWKFLENFVGTLCDLRFYSPFLWMATKEFNPIVPFPHVKHLGLSIPKNERDNTLFFHEKVRPRFILLSLPFTYENGFHICKQN